MIINDSNKIIYLGNGATKEWPFSFSITQASDIKVSLVNLDGEILNISSDYYVDITNKKVLYPGYVPGQEPSQAEQPPILPTGWKIIIYRSVPVTQETDLGANWPFNNIEVMADKLTMILQDLQEELSRAVKVEISSSTSPEELLDVIKESRDIAVQAAKDAEKVAEETVKKVEEQLNEKVEIAQAAAENAANKAVENVEEQLNDEVIAAQFAAQTATEKAEIATSTANDITKKMEVAQETVEKAKLQADRAEGEANRAEKMADAFDMTNYYQKSKIDVLLADKANNTDIPTTLPADGGNADTVDGKHATDLMRYMGYYPNTLLSAAEPNTVYTVGGATTDKPAGAYNYGSLETTGTSTKMVQRYTTHGVDGSNVAGQFASWYRVSYGGGYSAWKQIATTDSPTFIGTPTAPTPESSDNSTKVATTAFVQTVSKANGGIVAQSLGETGWVKFANGLIMQWGTVSANFTADNETKTITLPISFTSQHLFCSISETVGYAVGNTIVGVDIYSKSNENFIVKYCWDKAGEVTIRFFCIGV